MSHADANDFSPPHTFEIGQTKSCQCSRDGIYRMCEIVEQRIQNDTVEYYVHYLQCDKRMDEWVGIDRFQANDSEAAFAMTSNSPDLQNARGRKVLSRKRKVDDVGAVDETFEKVHEQITKIRNIDSIQIGKYEVDSWYYSPYPDEYSKLKKLYICEYCLKYMRKSRTLERHTNECDLRHPPGNEIYRHDGLSIFEVDGKYSKIYCQNLCLLSKLFLDHKTLYFDVEPFLFYILCEVSDEGFHIVGYFSKEKQSPENYNLACILVFPQYQRKGYGKFLIALSYELSRRENRVGSPEKPLSDLGRLSYISFWTELLLDIIKKQGREIHIKNLSQITFMKIEDIIATLQSLNMVKYVKGQYVISTSLKLIETHLEQIKRLNASKAYKYFRPTELEWEPSEEMEE